MKNHNFFSFGKKNENTPNPDAAKWEAVDDDFTYDEFDDDSAPEPDDDEEEPQFVTSEDVKKAQAAAEKKAAEFREGEEAGERYADSIIEAVKAGTMTREEAMERYEELVARQEARAKRDAEAIAQQKADDAEKRENERKNLFDKINEHPVAKKVVAGALSVALAAAGFMTLRRAIKNSEAAAQETTDIVSVDENYEKSNNIYETDQGVTYVYEQETSDEEDDSGDIENGDSSVNADSSNDQGDSAVETVVSGEENETDFETMPNGVMYSKEAYSDENRDKKNDFTNDFQEVYGDAEGTAEALYNAVKNDPIYLAAIFGKLPDEMKGDYAGMSDTVLANTINGENGAEAQKFMLEAVKNAIDDGEIEFFSAEGGEQASIEYEKRGKGSNSSPADVLLATRQDTLKEGDNLVRIVLKNHAGTLVFDDDCGNVILFQSTRMEDDGHVPIDNEDNPVVTPEDNPDVPPEDNPDVPPEDNPDVPPEDNPDVPPEDNPDVPPEDDPDVPPEDNPDEKPASKDTENMIRIDEQINDDIADDIGTKDIVIPKTEDVVKEEGEATDKPIDIPDGTGTEHDEFVPNKDSQDAEVIDQEQVKNDGNDYSENKGGANDDEYAPVEDDHEAQEEADKKAGLEDDHGGMTDEEIDDLYRKYFPEDKNDNDAGNNADESANQDNQSGDQSESNGTAQESGNDLTSDEKYKEVIAAQNKEEAENMSEDEFEDIMDDLGIE